MSSLKPIRVVFADDNELMREILAVAMNEAGFEVQAAHNGENALKMVKFERPDLLLSDIDMPGMDGVELLRQVRQLDPSLPVIMMTGNDKNHVHSDEIGEKGAVFISKPFRPNMLVEMIRGLTSPVAS